MEHLASGEENDNNESFPCAKHTAVLAPHFDQIANHHYRPAFDEGCSKSGQKLLPSRLTRKHLISQYYSGTGTKRRITYPRYQRLFAMTAAHTNDELQRLDEQFPLNWRNLRMISI